MIKIICRPELNRLNISKGANFCHVRRINKIIQDIFLLILGNQKCIGAPPNLRIKDNIIKIIMLLSINIEYHDKL